VTRAGCVQSVPEGYAWNLWPEEPRPLLTQSSAAPLGGVVKAGSLRLEPLPTDAKTHAVEMRLVDLTRDELTLELLSLGSSKPVSLWRRTVALGRLRPGGGSVLGSAVGADSDRSERR
jgi:hypothetical protein